MPRREPATAQAPCPTCGSSRWVSCSPARSAASSGRLRRRGHQDRAARRGRSDARNGAARSRTASRCGGRSSRATRSRSTLNAARAGGPGSRPRLVAESDILIENFRPGTMEKWGLGYDELVGDQPAADHDPRLRLRPDRPLLASKAGYGAIGEAMGGLRYVVGDPSTPPARMGISIGDTLAATFACIGALMALHARAADRPRPGRRQRDLRGGAGVMEIAGHRIRQGRLHPRADRRDPAQRRAVQRLSDQGRRIVLIGANQDTRVQAAGRSHGPAGARRPIRASPPTPRAARNQAELDDLIAALDGALDRAGTRASCSTSTACRAATSTGRPKCWPTPHFQARDAIVEVAHPQLGELRMQNVAPKLSATPGSVARRRPGARRAQRRGLPAAARPRRRTARRFAAQRRHRRTRSRAWPEMARASEVTGARMPTKVEIVEVSPRDGLQNEAQPVSTADKVELIAKAGRCGGAPDRGDELRQSCARAANGRRRGRHGRLRGRYRGQPLRRSC